MKSKYRALFVGFAEATQTSTSATLRDMLDGVGETLLDFADKAENARGRQGFFDADVALKKGRRRIQQGFEERVRKGFESFVTEQTMPSQGRDAEEMSLVDKDSFEDNLAVQIVASRVSRKCHSELFALKRRLAVINQGVKIEEQDLPGGPYHLAQSFAESLDGLPIEKRIKLILHALFHKRIMRDVEVLYRDFNAQLIEAGVLPYFRPGPEQSERYHRPTRAADEKTGKKVSQRASSPQTGRAQGTASAPSESAPSCSGGLSETVLRDVLELMGRRTVGSAGANPYLTPSGGPALPAEQIAGAIGKAQSQAVSPAMAVRDAALVQLDVDSALMARVGEALSRERELIMDLTGRDKLRTIDSDTIDLVGMLFEYMLGVEELPNVVKALLSHLHTPYLKLAILDQSFLDSRDHPARTLLDRMIEAGSSLVVETDLRRGIYPGLRDTVNRIVSDFKDDTSLFAELLDGFSRRVGRLKDQTKISERRAQQAEQGRQQLKRAQQDATDELKRLVGDEYLPQVVADFLRGFLAERLTLILLRGSQPQGSSDWSKTTGLARVLIEVSGRKGLANWRANRAKLAGLRKVIAAEPKLLGSYYSRQVERLLGWLAEVEHQGATPKSMQQLVAPDPAGSTEPVRDGRAPFSPEQRAMAERLEEVKFGTLFELKLDGEDSKRRLRLSWYNPTTTRYLFVNQDGGTAAVKDLASLAAELASGDARIITLPGQAFVERALHAIRDRFGRQSSETTDQDGMQSRR
jgi:hypothetical protein